MPIQTSQRLGPDVDPDYFRELLRFIYTDEIAAEALEEMADELLSAANRFGLERSPILLSFLLFFCVCLCHSVFRVRAPRVLSRYFRVCRSLVPASLKLQEVRTDTAAKPPAEHNPHHDEDAFPPPPRPPLSLSRLFADTAEPRQPTPLIETPSAIDACGESRLKALSAEQLSRSLAADNVCDILALASDEHAPQLQVPIPQVHS
eukprot:1544851-Rhodomonas_salina.1